MKARIPIGRRKKLINNTNIPQHKIEAIARCLLPDILSFFESEEGQREFEKWREQRKSENNVESEQGCNITNDDKHS